MSNNNSSLLVGLTILAVGGLGLFIYKSSNDTEEEEEDEEDNNCSSSENDSSSDEECKPPAKKQRAKTQRSKREPKGTKRRY
jgi:hypothetical protein